MPTTGRLLCISYAAVVTLCALVLSGRERLALGLAPAPFGPWRLAVMQVAVSIPLASWLVCRVGLGRWARVLFPACLVVVIGSLCAWGIFDYSLRASGLDFTARWLWRALFATVAMMPICAIFVGDRVPQTGFLLPASAFLFALAPPGLFAWSIGNSTLLEIQDAAVQGRVSREIGYFTVMGDLRGEDWSAPGRPAVRLSRLREEKARLERLVGRLPIGLDRAAILARLDRLDEALATIGASEEMDGESQLLVGAILRAKGEWVEAAGLYLGELGGWETDASRPEADWAWIEGAGECLRRTGDHAGREKLYGKALMWFPGRAGECHLEMGSSAAESGHSARALNWWGLAERDNPGLTKVIGPLRARLLSNTPACLLGLSGVFGSR
jgi:tetratricopeptide (TPR) repeat protein